MGLHHRPTAIATVLLALGCQATHSEPAEPPAPYTDERPDYVGESDVAGVVLLSGVDGGIASGIAIGADRILTAHHVWESLSVQAPLEPRGDAFDGGARIGVGPISTRAVLLASGGKDEPHGDWAVLRVEHPSWRPLDCLALHDPSLAPDWSPAPDTPVMLVGYAGRMFEGKRVNARAPAPVVLTQVSDVPDSFRAELRTAWYLNDREMDLAGVSGGAVCVWDTARERLEVMGVFNGQFEIERRVEGPLGLIVSRSRRRHMFFSRLPLAGLAAGLHTAPPQ